MTPQQTTIQAVDPIFTAIVGVSVVLLLGITAAMTWFVLRYHRSRAPEPTSLAAGNLWLEIVWTLLPTCLVLAMFYYGWSGYLSLRTVPKGSMEVTAIARMWSWQFRYADGRTSPKLVVPVGRPIKVNLESRDVLHGFYIPAFRVKRDVVPGMANHVWFVAPKSGSYDIFCSVFCGTGHSAMLATIEALPEPEFAAWQKNAPSPPTPPDGARIAKEKGCLACHSLDGSKGVGPSFKGLFGSRVSLTKDGAPLSLVADEAFLRESIRQPKATIVEGFAPIMPEYPDLSDADLEALLIFIKGAK